ncbi:MAG TPA: TetR/AcrR family transcriptional regulator [Gemmatimonadaceae bacterium]|nr:TetR/AcrR family transcriptional regulator [Gemmatimonadaceae bacterium]
MDRRTSIVDAATAVMARQGYQQTSVDDVIREAGLCGKSHFYHYFDSKEELGYAVLKHQFNLFADRGLALLRDSAVGPLDRLNNFLDWVVQVHSDCHCEGSASPCGSLAAEMAEQREGFRQHVDQLFEQWIAQIQTLLQEVNPRPDGAAAAERMARFIVATLEGALFMSRVKRDAAVLKTIATDLQRYVAANFDITPSPLTGAAMTVNEVAQ